MKLALGRVGSSDNQSDNFNKLLHLVLFWTHTNAIMDARFLTKLPRIPGLIEYIHIKYKDATPRKRKTA
jgi:hypothetical protein